MAVVNPPGWQQNAGATHTAAQMRSYIGGFMGAALSAGSLVGAGGVSPQLGNLLAVTQTGSPSMAVLVKSGVAFIPGSENGTQGTYGVMNDADVTLTVTANGSGNARIDSIFFSVADSQYSGVTNAASLVIVAGTPSGSPVAPSTPANSLRLADIAVANGASSITNANITDKRVWLGTPAGTVIPNVQVFTSSSTWTMPDGAKWIHVQIVGGGGAGGGSVTNAAGSASVGSGGGGGEYAEAWFNNQISKSLGVTVGAGGTGSSGANGGNGTTSSFNSVTALGGSGGLSRATGNASFGIQGGAGGSGGTGGNFRLSGSAGANAWGDAFLAISGNGGNSGGGFGGGAAGARNINQPAQAAGTNGGTYGGGGSGSVTGGAGTAQAGGNGAAGIVIITTYF